MWGDAEAASHCSSKGTFTLAGETPPATPAGSV
jgi:hypothetical protein